eukprot:7378562-Prymnesium_polylepis.1
MSVTVDPCMTPPCLCCPSSCHRHLRSLTHSADVARGSLGGTEARECEIRVKWRLDAIHLTRALDA